MEEKNCLGRLNTYGLQLLSRKLLKQPRDEEELKRVLVALIRRTEMYTIQGRIYKTKVILRGEHLTHEELLDLYDEEHNVKSLSIGPESFIYRLITEEFWNQYLESKHIEINKNKNKEIKDER